MKPSFIIAEAGVNHNGNFEIAKKLVDAAMKTGADSIKFQTFKAENLVTKTAQKAKYQDENIGKGSTQFEMLKKLELSYEDFAELKKYCDKKGILFLSTPFDEESADFLDSIGMEIFKIPSGEIGNKPLIQYIANKRRPIILSTGMSYLTEVEEALGWIHDTWGGTDILNNSKRSGLVDSYDFSLAILHCVSNYPASPSDINLKAMLTMRDEFNVVTGYSDHTAGIEIPIGAVAMGAEIIEKHFTLDKNMDGPDHRASLDPEEFKAMVSAIRNVEMAIGDGQKIPTVSEMNVREVARKSLVAVKGIKAGDVIKSTDICIKRPGTGILPKDRERVVGMKATKSIEADSVIRWEDLN